MRYRYGLGQTVMKYFMAIVQFAFCLGLFLAAVLPAYELTRSTTRHMISAANLIRRKAHFQIANVLDRLPDVLSQKIGDLVTKSCLIKEQSAGIIFVFVLND